MINIKLTDIKYDTINYEGHLLTIKRLDLIHPIISGNKYFKLIHFLEDYKKKELNVPILSFGGAYSNHLIALSYLCNLNKIKSIGVIRGEKVENSFLNFCSNNGMCFKFISRSAFRTNKNPLFLEVLKEEIGDFYLIPEGASSDIGILGSADMITFNDLEKFETISCTVGSGTMLSGVLKRVFYKKDIKVLAFPALKGQGITKKLLTDLNVTNFEQLKIIEAYHFGGFAKQNQELVNFINWFETTYHIPLDSIYSAKMLFGIFDLIDKNSFPYQKVLLIHCGKTNL